LQARPCRYGGVRWYAECHHTGRSVAKLYLPPGVAHFRARQAWRVAYRSQNVAAGLSRLCFRRDRYLRRKLNDADPFLLLRPRGMRWHTYQWHMQKIDALHLAIDREMMRRFGVHAPF